MIFRSPQFLFLLVLIPAIAALWWWRRGRVASLTLVLRLLTVGLIVVALANPIIGAVASPASALVVLLDQSDSLGEQGKADLRAQAQQLVAAHTGPVSVVEFGANTVATLPGETAPLDTVLADQTDIAGALDVARGLIDAGGGRVVLLSDGAQTLGDAQAAARTLQVPVDTVAYEAPARPEVWIIGVEAPQTLRADEQYSVTVLVGSSAPTTAQLVLIENGQQLAAQDVPLSAGENRFNYPARAGQPGMVRLEARIASAEDSFAENNIGGATALIAPQPRILLVESRSGTAARLRAALRRSGIQADIVAAPRLPSQLSDLSAYEGITLVDVPAGDLTLDQMATLREFVRSEGRGLLATGGRSSFTLGAYKGTPLEEVLPVEMTPPPRPERPPVTLLIILDHSLSMGSVRGISKLDMAKESALLATESLREEDRLGVLAFDDSQDWVVDFQTLGSGLSLAQIQERLSSVDLGGGTDICAALAMGLSELERQPGSVRHAVLMTDGQSFRNDSCPPYETTIDRARAQDITLSSIAIGQDADQRLLQELARAGAGRYHFAAQPEDIPRLTLLESQIASAEPQIEGDFRAVLQAPHPLLRDFAPNQIPRLEGYVGTTIKPDAELVLKSPDDDPILATWQYGLGRAVAWTPSVDDPWASSWPNWPEYGTFWAQIIRYTLPAPDSGPLQVRIQPSSSDPSAVTIAADALAPNGEPVDLADTVANVTLPDGSARRVPLGQIAPGRYTADVTLSADGPYAIDVQQTKDGEERAASAGYVQKPSAEYTPQSGGAALLERISATTGGAVLSSASAQPTVATAPGAGSRELWPWLLLAAAVLWPLEIGIRRGLWRR